MVRSLHDTVGVLFAMRLRVFHYRHFWTGLQIAVTLVLVALLLQEFEWKLFIRYMTSMSLGFYAASFLVVLVGQCLYACRWWFVLREVGIKASLPETFQQHLVGTFFNNFLPSTVGGDWSKVYYLGQRKGYLDVLASVVGDRVVGLYTVVTLATLLIWLSGLSDSGSSAIGSVFKVLIVAWGMMTLVLMLTIFSAGDRIFSWLSSRFDRVISGSHQVRRLMTQLRTMGRRPRVILATFVLTSTYFVLLSLVYQKFFGISSGETTGFFSIMAISTSIVAFSNVPVSLNGIGLREQLHYLLFAGLGVPKEAAVGISLLLFSHMLLFSTLGACVWLQLSYRRRRMMPK